MTGADVKRQVMKALRQGNYDDWKEVADALYPCIVLTAEEAALVLTHFGDFDAPDAWCLDLLTPEKVEQP